MVSFVVFTDNCKANDGKTDSTDFFVNQLINEYVELFSITDQNGTYHQNFENRFRNLFVDEAVIFNFLPDTEKYNYVISINDYIEAVITEMTDRIIRPGITEFYIAERSRLNEDVTDIFIYKVLLNKTIHFYSKDNYENLYNSELDLVIEIIVDKPKRRYRIQSVKPALPKVVTLSYTVYFPDRLPVKNQVVFFTYFDREIGKEVVRKRFTDHKGFVHISNVPEYAELKISTNDDFEIILDVDKTARQWSKLSEKDRFIILHANKKIKRLIKPFKLRLGTKYHFPILHAIVSNYKHYAFENPVIDLIPDFDYQFLITRYFFLQQDFGLALGFGFEYNSMKINVETRNIVFYNSEMKNSWAGNQSDFITGRIIKEQYNWEGIRFPFFLTYIYYSDNKLFESIDLSLVFRYHISPTITYSLMIEEIPEADGDNSGETAFIIEGFTGEFKQDRPFSVALEMAFNFNLYKDLLIMQYSLAYGLTDIGNKQRLYFHGDDPNNSQNTYNPFLKNNQLKYYNLALGLGFAIKF